jgi:hypothetical protein
VNIPGEAAGVSKDLYKPESKLKREVIASAKANEKDLFTERKCTLQ